MNDFEACVCGSAEKTIKHGIGEYGQMSWSCECQDCGVAIREAKTLKALVENWNEHIDSLKEKAPLPCPFCGREASISQAQDGLSCAFCANCKVSTMIMRNAVEVWNTRAASGGVKIKFKSCGDCIFWRYQDGDEYCAHPDLDEPGVLPGPVPEWCPMKSAPATFVLDKNLTLTGDPDSWKYGWVVEK